MFKRYMVSIKPDFCDYMYIAVRTARSIRG